MNSAVWSRTDERLSRRNRPDQTSQVPGSFASACLNWMDCDILFLCVLVSRNGCTHGSSCNPLPFAHRSHHSTCYKARTASKFQPFPRFCFLVWSPLADPSAQADTPTEST